MSRIENDVDTTNACIYYNTFDKVLPSFLLDGAPSFIQWTPDSKHKIEN